MPGRLRLLGYRRWLYDGLGLLPIVFFIALPMVFVKYFSRQISLSRITVMLFGRDAYQSYWLYSIIRILGITCSFDGNKLYVADIIVRSSHLLFEAHDTIRRAVRHQMFPSTRRSYKRAFVATMPFLFLDCR
jgi:hypothetical protein